jgi:pilus assembly protein Flp/PilA
MNIALKTFSLAKPVMLKLNLSQGFIDKAYLPSLHKFFTIKSQKGVTMIEYAMIAGLVSIVVVEALNAIGGQLTTIFTTISDALAVG